VEREAAARHKATTRNPAVTRRTCRAAARRRRARPEEVRAVTVIQLGTTTSNL
jgi:hypothetical protein